MAEDAQPVVSDRLLQALGYLKDHPHSSARDIADGTAMRHYDRDVYRMLSAAAFKGYCQCSRARAGSGPWLWEICPDGLSLIAQQAGGTA
jgi:hypothetical protein